MTREDDIRGNIKTEKRPKTMIYLAMLIGIAVLLAFYFAAFHGADFFDVVNVDSQTAAQKTTSDISSGVSDVSGDLDAIEQILGSG